MIVGKVDTLYITEFKRTMYLIFLVDIEGKIPFAFCSGVKVNAVPKWVPFFENDTVAGSDSRSA